MGFELSAENAVRYLMDRDVLTPADGRDAVAEFLGGGVSNIVIKVHVAGDGDRGLVLKQSLPKLRVEDDWFADRKRIHRERAGIDYLGGNDYLASQHEDAGGSRATWSVPRVVDEDRENFVFVMTAAPRDGANWKEQLLGGHIDVVVAERVGSMLGEIHGSSMVVGADVPDGLTEFEDLECFVQLRIDPYHRATALAHPDLEDVLESEASRMLPGVEDRRALVHGDFSPKNIIVSGQGNAAEVFLLDFEVVHLGNPVFDLAFMLNHMTLKAIHRPEWAERYCRSARGFWDAYLASVGGQAGDEETLERDTVRQLGALLLARIDGKSPAEYITGDEEKRYARETARALLMGEVVSLADLHDRLTDVVARGRGSTGSP